MGTYQIGAFLSTEDKRPSLKYNEKFLRIGKARITWIRSLEWGCTDASEIQLGRTGRSLMAEENS